MGFPQEHGGKVQCVIALKGRGNPVPTFTDNIFYIFDLLARHPLVQIVVTCDVMCSLVGCFRRFGENMLPPSPNLEFVRRGVSCVTGIRKLKKIIITHSQ
jgi:hypothetical protein